MFSFEQELEDLGQEYSYKSQPTENFDNLYNYISKQDLKTVKDDAIDLLIDDLNIQISSNWRNFNRKNPRKIIENQLDNNSNKNSYKYTSNNENSNFVSLNNYVPHYFDVVALDCEMVGASVDGCIDLLARVSIVDSQFDIIFDTFVKPQVTVTDYRFKITGITKKDLENGMKYKTARNNAIKFLSGKIIVGHGLNNDFRVLNYQPPLNMIRDTSSYLPLHPKYNISRKRNAVNKRLYKPKLVDLANFWFKDIEFQKGHHSSVDDASMAMKLYMTKQRQWEKSMSIAMY